MRIGICLRTLSERGGIAVYSRNVVRAMLPMAPQHHFVLYYRDPAHVGGFGAAANITERVLRAPEKWTWDQVVVPWQARRDRLDVIFHTKFTIPLASPCATAMVLHGSERFVFPQFSTRGDMLYFHTIYPMFLRRASAILSVSENARKDIIRFLHIDPTKVHTVHLAASGTFRPVDDPAALAAVRAKYALPERFILNVGLIYPGKNIPNLLEALKRVRAEAGDVKLVIAGTGKRMYARDLEMIRGAGLADAVLMPGYITHDDLSAVYSLARAVVFPSYYESFPAIPLEANACGCPVVTSRTGGTPEAAGDAALYVDPTDVPGIAAATLRAIGDEPLRADLIRRGFENARRFSWDQTARATLAVLESLARR
ncbi:MAG: glycosyltransferase family 4 protein [Candidatus Eisenbacteria bacterium]|nr:glycosyltransferase family 4 protein [Candidatus Eisenbacteria bacterium]